MKKVFILVILLNCSALFCSDFSFSVRPFFSYNNDILTYSIYDGTKLNSRLDWKTPYLFKAGVNLSLMPGKWIIDISNAAAIPLQCGTMADKDWYTENIQTNLSLHNLTPDFCYDLKIKLQYQFNLKNDWTLLSGAAFYYSYTSLRGAGGNGWCGDSAHTGLFYDVPWNDEAAVQVQKFGIDLYNRISTVLVGIGVRKKLDRWQLSSNLYVSPYIYISSIDHHLNNYGGRYYLLIQEAFFASGALDLSCSYRLNDKSKLSICPELHFCKEIKGVFYSGKEQNPENLIDQPCSFNFAKFSISFAWEWQF